MAGKITQSTIVKNTEMIDGFLHEVAEASTRSFRENKPLLLLVSCHGIRNGHLPFDFGKHSGLSIQILKGILESGSRVTLVTTACYLGG